MRDERGEKDMVCFHADPKRLFSTIESSSNNIDFADAADEPLGCRTVCTVFSCVGPTRYSRHHSTQHAGLPFRTYLLLQKLTNHIRLLLLLRSRRHLPSQEVLQVFVHHTQDASGTHQPGTQNTCPAHCAFV